MRECDGRFATTALRTTLHCTSTTYVYGYVYAALANASIKKTQTRDRVQLIFNTAT
jgi:hypothetical protein